VIHNLVRCPKCRSDDLCLTETTEATMSFRQGCDGTIWREWGSEEFGNIIRTEAFCGCGHSWKLRGITMISELAGYQPHDPLASVYDQDAHEA